METILDVNDEDFILLKAEIKEDFYVKHIIPTFNKLGQ